MALIGSEGNKERRIERGVALHEIALEDIVNHYRYIEREREQARELVRRSRAKHWWGRGEDYQLRYYAADDDLKAADFDTDWELRVHRNMIEQLRARLRDEIESLQEDTEDVMRQVGSAGERAKNKLPRPYSEPSAQQSSKVREEAANRLSDLLRFLNRS